MDRRDLEIVLVGNGPSIKDYPRGRLIDSFPIIVRFNYFAVDSFFAGTRITTWCCRRPHNKTKAVDFRQLREILTFGPADQAGKVGLQKLSRKYNCCYTLIPYDFYCSLQNTIDSKVPDAKARASTGLIVAYYYLEYLQVPQIHIVGFDHLIYKGKLHYFDEKTYPPNSQRIHFTDIEREYFDAWERAGKVVRL